MTSPEERLVEGLNRERNGYAALLKEIRGCAGDAPFQDYFREHEIEDPEAYELTRPGLLAQAMNHRISDPRLRAAIAKATLRLSPTLDRFAQISPTCQELNATGVVRLPRLGQPQLGELVADIGSIAVGAVEGTLEKLQVKDIVAARHVLPLAASTALLFLAGEFLSCAPTIVNIEAWWTPPTGQQNPPETLHRDKDDFRACKFFMYLTDVLAREDGPHVYARGSADPDAVQRLIGETATPTTLEQAFYMGAGGRQHASDNERLFADRLTEVLGPAGTCFMTNSHGLHRGVPPARGRRGLFAVTYASTAYPHRLKRFSEVVLSGIPAGCADNALTRHALRLLLR